ncbi:MAG: hypothetical protein IPK26_19470 [Planctomycetes bacterium]|nr:hypothetical protein [Planctomycetota bacterium]
MSVLPLVLSVPLLAQAPGVSDATRLAAFERQYSGPWQTHWNPATGTPQSIYGAGIPLADWRENTLQEARRHADRLLREQAELLELGVSEFRETIGARMGRTWSFVYDQYFRGLPVIGGRADVRVHMNGRISMFGSVAWPVPATFDTMPKIDELTATAAAWQSRQVEPTSAVQPGQPQKPRLVIWGNVHDTTAAPFFLAWEIPISAILADGSGPAGRAYIDAGNGRLLHWQSDKHECGLAACTRDHASPRELPPATYTVMGWVHTAFSPLSTPTNEPLAGLEINVPGIGVLVTDRNGQFTANLTNPTQVTVNLNGIHNQLIVGSNAVTQTATLQPGVPQTIQLGTAASTEQQLAHMTTYYWTDRVNEFMRSILGNTPQLATADNVLPTVNLAQTCNAFYTNNSINFYASGGGCTNTSSASVVAHEWGHGLDDRYGGISQTNGLSEGWADIHAIYMLDDPIIAHDFYTNGNFLRTGTNTRQYPSGSGPHDQGETWMGFAWKLRQNLRASNGPAALTISNDIVLGTIVANATDQQAAIREVFIADDNDGNLANGVPHYNELEQACLVHNLPYPVIQAGSASHNPLTSTAAQLTSRPVTVSMVPTFGSFTQVRLHYDAGGAQVRTMIATGTANVYQAMLPGVLAPTTVRYHFEGVHSTGITVRLPAQPTAEFSYDVRGETRIWFEDFENGGTGWTHGAITGVDEWEIGAPQGRSGGNWTDPSAAASGSNCAGTDLTGNGAYENSSTIWLRSPPISTVGFTDVRLRLKRWLTIDAGTADQVQYRVGAIPFWVNPSSQQQIDTGWVQYEQAVPFAQGLPAAVLEFRLISNASGTFGGLQIDDIELFTTSAPVALPAELRILPEQVAQGGTLNLTVDTGTALPFLLILGSGGGPTTIPGLPPILVSSSFATLPGYTNATGDFALTFPAPNGVPATGMTWFSQVLTLGQNQQIVASNQFLNLITQ